MSIKILANLKCMIPNSFQKKSSQNNFHGSKNIKEIVKFKNCVIQKDKY